MGKIKARKYMKDSLHEQYRMGYGQQKIKDVHNSTPYIHSENTYLTYIRECNKFSDWLKSKGVSDPEQAKQMIGEYGQSLEERGLSPFSVYTALCGICKAFHISTTEIGYKAPKRKRADITRSRLEVKRDSHFSVENNKDLVTFCRCSGLRRRELEALRGSDADRSTGHIMLYIKNGKGGKKRNVMMYGTEEELNRMWGLIQKAGDNQVFDKVSSACDVHHYRSEYACKVYKRLARKIEEIPMNERYYCRNDMKGKIFDKRAMLIVSRLLGHNRIDVIANNYLYDLHSFDKGV